MCIFIKDFGLTQFFTIKKKEKGNVSANVSYPFGHLALKFKMFHYAEKINRK